jgi:hypothetical protein
MAHNNGTTAVVENVNVENVDVADENENTEVNETAFSMVEWQELDLALAEKLPTKQSFSFSCDYDHAFARHLRAAIVVDGGTNANYVMMALARRSGFDCGKDGENLPTTRGKVEFDSQEIAYIKAAILKAVNKADYVLAGLLNDGKNGKLTPEVMAACKVAIDFGKAHKRNRKNGKVETTAPVTPDESDSDESDS